MITLEQAEKRLRDMRSWFAVTSTPLDDDSFVILESNPACGVDKAFRILLFALGKQGPEEFYFRNLSAAVRKYNSLCMQAQEKASNE